MSERYNTQQRAAILSFFAAHPDDCFTARDLISDGRLKVGEATVYRVLSRLTEEGAVARFSGGGRGALYRYVGAPGCAEHVHLKCLGCGGVIHLDCRRLGDFTKHIEAEHKFSVDSGRTVLYGLCRSCREPGNGGDA